MRGTVAKRIRKKVYGDLSFRDKKYLRRKDKGNIIVDPKRTEYQETKKAYMRWKSGRA